MVVHRGHPTVAGAKSLVPATCTPTCYCNGGSNNYAKCYQDPCGVNSPLAQDCPNAGACSGQQCAILFRWDGINCVGGLIQTLNMGFFSMSGTLPPANNPTYNFTALGTTVLNIFLQNNQLSGSIDGVFPTTLTTLQNVDLQNNLFSGVIPTSLLQMPSLQQLNLYNNRFTSFPQNVGAGGGLKSIRFNDNLIAGSLPQSAIQNLVNIQGFYGYNNRMTGVLPDLTLPGSSQHPNILFFLMSNNSFRGPLPNYLNGQTGSGGTATLTNFDVSLNPLDCLLPSTIINWVNVVNLTGNVGFFCNPSFNVQIPPQIIGVGSCIQATLLTVLPVSGSSALSSITLIFTGNGFNHCPRGWLLQYTATGAVTLTQPSPSGGLNITVTSDSQMTATLANPAVGQGTTIKFGMYSVPGSVLFSSNIYFNFIAPCPVNCIVGGHILGCDQTTGACQCEQGYSPSSGSGPLCSFKACPGPCNTGTCNNSTGNCDCPPNFSGIYCQTASKPCLQGWDQTQAPNKVYAECSGVLNGACNPNNGQCQCQQFGAGIPSYSGLNCSARACSTNCNAPYGFCQTIDNVADPSFTLNGGVGACQCDSDHYGDACQNARIQCTPPDCYGHGNCDFTQGICRCYPGWGGGPPSQDCSQCVPGYLKDSNDNCVAYFSCANNCYNSAGRGVCDVFTGLCNCTKDDQGFAEWQGTGSLFDCSVPACPNNCNGQGECVQCSPTPQSPCPRMTVCQCYSGYSGDQCQTAQQYSKKNPALAVGLAVLFIVLAALLGLYALRRYKIKKFKEQNGGVEMK